jgi:hypothetical protein
MLEKNWLCRRIGAARGVGLVSLVALLTLGCDPRPFFDLEDDAPVVLFKRSKALDKGFGVSISAISTDGEARFLVGGTPGESRAGVYTVTADGVLGADPTDTAACSGDEPPAGCDLANQTAGLAVARAGADDEDFCFIVGMGISATSPDVTGLVGRCGSRVEYTLRVPNDFLEVWTPAKTLNGEHQPLVLASDTAESPGLVAGARQQSMAWYYPPRRSMPIMLEAPAEEGSGRIDTEFGETVAVGRLSPGQDEDTPRLIAVGAPKSDHVHLYRSDGPGEVVRVGCLGGPNRFGRALTMGDVAGDGADDLVVSDETNGHVFSGMALASLEATNGQTCSLASLPAGGLVASFGCGSRVAIEGCETSDFGAAIAVGDLDADGDGEVIVGAPEMKVRDVKRAGALLIFDIDEDQGDPTELTEFLFLSSAETDDKLGASIATASIDDRGIIAAGAPGRAKAALFFCSTLIEGTSDSRCK